VNAVPIVEDFWAAVWKTRSPGAIQHFVVDEFVLVTGGKEIKNKENFIAWVRDFLERSMISNLRSSKIFQNENGTRVASLWRVKRKNNGILGTPQDQRPIAFTGSAIWTLTKMESWFATASSGPHGRCFNSRSQIELKDSAGI
jgi:hypothetical protein